MRIAVTGGLGFIGQEIVTELIKNGDEVIIVDFWQSLLTKYEKARLPIMTQIYENLPKCYSVIDPFDFLENIVRLGPATIIHAGAVVDTCDLGDGDLWDHNVSYTEELVSSVVAADNTDGFLFISSAAAYGCSGSPNNPYGLTKSLGETIVKRLERVVTLRLFNVFGRYEHHKGNMASVPWKLANAYKTRSRFEMHSLDARRDFVPVQNVVSAVMVGVKNLACDIMGKQSVYDVGTGESTTFEDLDNFVMQSTRNNVSCVNPIDQPSHLKGRYQTFTQAGVNGVPRLGGISTREGIELYYGK